MSASTNSRKEALLDRRSCAVILFHKHRETLAMIGTLACSLLIGALVAI